MNAANPQTGAVNPLSAHNHETDDMTVQFASAELQDQLTRTLHSERMSALGLPGNYEVEDEERYRSIVIDNPESVERFTEAMAAAGEDVTEGVPHDVRHLNINLGDLGLVSEDRLDLDDIDPAIRAQLIPGPELSEGEQAFSILRKLWPVPGRLITTADPGSIIHEFYDECQLLQTEIILNTIEEIPDEDQTTLRSMLLAVTVNPEIAEMRHYGQLDDETPAQQERIDAVNERIERQMARVNAEEPDPEINEDDMERSIIYGAASYLRASAECARRMQQRLHEDGNDAKGENRSAVQQVLFDVAIATQPIMTCLHRAPEDGNESIIRRGKEAESQILEIYEAEFGKFNEDLPTTIMPYLAERATASTLKLAEQVPVDIAGVTLAVINEHDPEGFRKLHPEAMKAAEDYSKLYPVSKITLTNTVIAYHHEGRRYVQLPYEPHVRGYPSQRAWSDAIAILTMGEHPNPVTEEGLKNDAAITAEAAYENVHDIDEKRLQHIVDACRGTGMSDPAIREIIENLVMINHRLAERLVEMTDLKTPRPSRRQVRKIVSACRSAGLDEHDIAKMLEEIGWDNMKSAGVKRHQATRQDVEAIAQAVQQAYSDQEAGEDAAELAEETLAEWRV